MIANNALARNDATLSKSLERLSSGYKINHAKDNAAGLAMSRRMNAQLKGLDVAGDNALRCINSGYRTTLREGETEEEYAQRRAIGMSVTLSPGNPYNLTVGKSDDLSEKLGHPVYLVSFLTGSDLNATCWTVYLTRTEHYSYQYAIAAASQTSLTLEDQIMDYFGTLTLAEMSQA